MSVTTVFLKSLKSDPIEQVVTSKARGLNYASYLRHLLSLSLMRELFYLKPLAVVYFDQYLGAGHSKCWLKYAFSMFFVQES